MLLVSIIGFSVMPCIIVVLPENILDIALWVKNPRWPPYVQVKAINSFHFRHNRGRFVFLLPIMGFSGMPYTVVLVTMML